MGYIGLHFNIFSTYIDMENNSGRSFLKYLFISRHCSINSGQEYSIFIVALYMKTISISKKGILVK